MDNNKQKYFISRWLLILLCISLMSLACNMQTWLTNQNRTASEQGTVQATTVPVTNEEPQPTMTSTPIVSTQSTPTLSTPTSESAAQNQAPDQPTATVAAITTSKDQEPTMIYIYAQTEWYQARPESEQIWQGVLQARDVPQGPATRTGLRYNLMVEPDQYPIYAPEMVEKFVPFLDQPVVISGKLVDLSDEGFGQELWVASIGFLTASK